MKKLAFFCVFVMTCQSLFALNRDAQFWENVYLEKKISRRVDIHLNQQLRISENWSQYRLGYADVGITQKLSKHIKVMADYVFVIRQTRVTQSKRHQWYGALYLKTKLKQFDFSWRIMYQQQVQDILSSDFGRIPQNVFRNKFTIKYNPEFYPWYRFTPYIAFESYYKTDKNDPIGPGFNRTRTFAGLFYALNKKTEFELYEMYEKHFNTVDPPENFVTGIGLSLLF